MPHTNDQLKQKTFDCSELDEASIKDEYSVFDCEDDEFDFDEESSNADRHPYYHVDPSSVGITPQKRPNFNSSNLTTQRSP